MALLMFDGFEAYPSTHLSVIAPAGAPWKSVAATWGAPRTGSRAITGRNSSVDRWVTKDFADPSEVFVGAGVRSDLAAAANAPAIKLRGDASGNICSLYINASGGAYELRTGAGTTLFQAPMAPNTWYYFEIGVTVNGATSSAELRVNGASVYSNGSVDLEVGGNVGVRDIMFCDHQTGSNDDIIVDDVYVCDASGAEHNTFLGPVRVHALSPNSDVEADWTPNSGTTHYTQVDDMPGGHDGDTSYVASSTVGDRDLYNLTDLAAEYQNPVAVQAYWAARHDNSSGGAGMAALLKSGATEVEGSEIALSASYSGFAEPLHATNPDTGAAWTPAEINALQIGAIVKSNL